MKKIASEINASAITVAVIRNSRFTFLLLQYFAAGLRAQNVFFSPIYGAFINMLAKNPKPPCKGGLVIPSSFSNPGLRKASSDPSVQSVTLLKVRMRVEFLKGAIRSLPTCVSRRVRDWSASVLACVSFINATILTRRCNRDGCAPVGAPSKR